LQHALIGAYGGRWKEVYLIVQPYVAYVDDSGTSPAQPVAIAASLIIPAVQIRRLDNEWAKFLEKEGIADFHTAECVARNPKSQFAAWDDDRVRRVLARVRQIIRKYAVQAYSVSVDKATYDEVIPAEFHKIVGPSHYTWAVDGMGGFARSWALERSVPLEYVFDQTGKEQKKEIERALEHGEQLFPGHYLGHYSFRNRKDVPALQCADLFAWTIFQRSKGYIHNKPTSPFGEECWQDFSTWKSGEDNWAGMWFATKPGLQEWVKRVYADENEMKRLHELA
jgi:hypothetical protein